MRVLLDCRMASWTGVGRYTVGLARALAARSDVELVQVVAQGDLAPVPSSAAGVVRATRHPFSYGGASELARLARQAAPDVVHCTHFPTPIPAPHPLVVTVHDLSPLLVPGIMPSALRRGVYRWWNARATTVADRIVVPSHHTKSDVERMFLAATGKTRVTLEAADDFACGPRASLTQELTARVGERYVFSMGSTRPHKDLPTLLRAFATIAPKHLGLNLVLAGAGDAGFVDRILVDTPADIRRRALFTGRIDDPVLRTLYERAAVFAFPSLHEGFGLPPLEAMALGTPVVVAEATSLPEVVGNAGLLFPPGDEDALADALGRVLDDDGLRSRLAASGLARAATFTWALTAERTVSAYREAVDIS